jgi:Raf kinase inhibitor-like YbhB/YbcL family protein
MGFSVTSPLFASGQAIPFRFTRLGENVSPPLVWYGPPDATQSFILLMEDVMGPWPHWLAYDIVGDHLPENAGKEGGPLRQGLNRYGRAAYDGPEPPPGETYHPYRFRLAALNCPMLDVGGRTAAADIWEASRPFQIVEAELIGIFTDIDPSAEIR